VGDLDEGAPGGAPDSHRAWEGAGCAQRGYGKPALLSQAR